MQSNVEKEIAKRKYSRDWYHRNKDKAAAYNKARRTKPEIHVVRLAEQNERREIRRDWLAVYKFSRGCSRCGYWEYPSALQLHHRDPSTKTRGTGGRTFWHSLSKDKLLAEIEKCNILCANCHSVEHDTWLQEETS